MDRNVAPDTACFILAAIITPIVLLAASISLYYVLQGFLSHSYKGTPGFLVAGLIFGLPSYLLIGLPLAWRAIRRTEALGNRRLIRALLIVAVIVNAVSFIIIAAACFLVHVGFACALLFGQVIVGLGFPHAILIALTFAGFYIGLRAMQPLP